MGRLGKIKPNEVKVRLEDYIHLVLGEGKTGKSTLYRDLINVHYNGDMSRGLLLAFEPGYKALDGLYAEDVDSWEDWEEILDELVSERKNLSYKFIAIDTIDKFVDMAIDKTLRASKKKDGVKVESINSAFGGFNRGKEYCLKLMKDSLDKLHKNSYGIFLIGHTKLKKKNTGVTLSDGQEYMQLSSNLTGDYESIFRDMADMMSFLVVDKEVSGDAENVKKRTAKSSVSMHFRSNGEIDCGGRFTELPSSLPYGAENYLKAFEQGVKSSILSPITDKEIEKRAIEQEKESDQKAEISSKEIPVSEMVAKVKSEFGNLGDGAKLKLQSYIEEMEVESLDEINETHREIVLKMYELVS
jgi:hypothetical protein